MSSITKFVTGAVGGGANTFKQTRETARMTGKLLAHFLALGRDSPVFGDHTFSFLGFSLGSCLLKSCVNRLRKLGMNKLIHNIYFMAGATYIRKERLQWQKNTFIGGVSGQIYSLHTTNDEALVVFETIYGHRSIGRNPQFTKDRHNALAILKDSNIQSYQD